MKCSGVLARADKPLPDRTAPGPSDRQQRGAERCGERCAGSPSAREGVAVDQVKPAVRCLAHQRQIADHKGRRQQRDQVTIQCSLNSGQFRFGQLCLSV